MSAPFAVLAGSVSTAIFVASALPMLWKAVRTKDLGSYSLGNIGLANLGNLLYAVYVFSLPPGPVWALHSFNMATTLAMLIWYVRFELRRRLTPSVEPAHSRSLDVDLLEPAGQR